MLLSGRYSVMQNNGMAHCGLQMSFWLVTLNHRRQPAASVPSRSGWLYLAVVIDLWSRVIIGWSMSQRMTDN